MSPFQICMLVHNSPDVRPKHLIRNNNLNLQITGQRVNYSDTHYYKQFSDIYNAYIKSGILSSSIQAMVPLSAIVAWFTVKQCHCQSCSIINCKVVHCLMAPMSVIFQCFTVRWRHCKSLIDGSTVSRSSMVYCKMVPLSVLIPWFTIGWHHCQTYRVSHRNVYLL